MKTVRGTGCLLVQLALVALVSCSHAVVDNTESDGALGTQSVALGVPCSPGSPAPSPSVVCGTSPLATAAECTSAVQVQCVSGSWTCTFPAGVCSGGCSPDDEVCDALDNDCDGQANENVPGFGQPCASDSGMPPPGHGPCRTTGTMICSGPNAVACSAVKADCNSLPAGCTEECDGIDNDCDGSIDETYNAPGSNATFYVKPNVTKVSATTWIYSYEASRPSATTSVPGTGDGYQTSAPTGATIDKTPACSVSSKLPWYNVTPLEAEQTCTAAGGSLCTTAQYQAACQATFPCAWGYAPRGAACTSSSTPSKFCNLARSWDSAPAIAGDQDQLLATASGSLASCYADWSGQLQNTAAHNKIFDITGNLQEITKTATSDYRLMGGSYLMRAEAGAACGNTNYTADQGFHSKTTGFRCCFTSNPSP